MTTNARHLRDEQPDNDQDFDELPNPDSLSLDADVTIGHTRPKNNKQRSQKKDNQTDSLPKEYQGKSTQELVEILRTKEAMIGRQANEIGHLRDLSDQLITSQTSASRQVSNSQSQQDEVQVSSDDILEDPRGAITRVVSPLINSAVEEIKGTVGGLQTNSAAQQFAQRHPTFEQDMNDPAFQQFVQSSKYRQKLALKAHNNTDFDAADELWTAWEEQRDSLQELDDDDDARSENNQQNDQRRRALNDAATVRSGNGEGGAASRKPVYSARKLQDMRNRDPDGYYDPKFQQMILDAYRDGRVR